MEFLSIRIFQNGVKKGVVFSSILFYLYIDRLLLDLKNSGLGCHINGTYMEAFSYSDDITLSCPNVQGLNKMMNSIEWLLVDWLYP